MSEMEMDQAPIVLMELAEQNLKEIRGALADLAAERVFLERERLKLEYEVKSLREDNKKVVADAVAAAAAETKQTIAAAAGETKAMTAGAATQLLESLKKGAAPILENLGNVTKQAATADDTLRNVTKWATRRLVGATVAVCVFLLVAGWLASNAVSWWDTKSIAAMQLQKDQLQQEIADLQANKAALVQAGMLDKITRCNPGNRPCVAVDESAGSFGYPGGQQDLRILQGY
jgi:hypothetical protein